MANYLVIGGGSGFGKAIAKDLLSNHNVWATYHTTQLDFTPTHMQRLNVLDEELTMELPQVLDGLVYAVGNIPLGGFHRSSPEDFLKDYSLQVLGAIKVLQRALPALKRSENPSVVLFSSVAGKKVMGFTRLCPLIKQLWKAWCVPWRQNSRPVFVLTALPQDLAKLLWRPGYLTVQKRKRKWPSVIP